MNNIAKFNFADGFTMPIFLHIRRLLYTSDARSCRPDIKSKMDRLLLISGLEYTVNTDQHTFGYGIMYIHMYSMDDVDKCIRFYSLLYGVDVHIEGKEKVEEFFKSV